jgi:hypothetical protein
MPIPLRMQKEINCLPVSTDKTVHAQYQFLAAHQVASATIGHNFQVSTMKIEKILIVGSGRRVQQIGLQCAMRSFNTTLYDTCEEAL